MQEWMQQNAVYLFLALLVGWVLWQRMIAPRLAGVRNISVTDYLGMRNRPHALIDVRTEGEWRGGHAPQAEHIPLAEISRRFDAIPRDVPVVVICASGQRSAQAATVLARHGIAPVYNFSGGMAAWRAAGLPVKTGR